MLIMLYALIKGGKYFSYVMSPRFLILFNYIAKKKKKNNSNNN